MMDSQSHEIFDPSSSWPFYSIINSNNFDYDLTIEMADVHVDTPQFSSSSASFSTLEDTISSISSLSAMIPSYDQSAQSPGFSDDQLQALSVEDFLLDNEEMEFLHGQISESDERISDWSPDPSVESTPIQSSLLVLPGGESELESRLGVLHLLKAYGEAVEKNLYELADEIKRCLSDKVSLAGEPLFRLTFNLCQDLEKQGDYLRQESSKNYETAFRAFYQIFPYGRFAHFAANSAILDAIPADGETTIRLVDFDMGEGIQWPPLLEALARQRKGAVKLTAIKWEKEDQAPSMRSFEEAKRRLVDHARQFGLKLKVEEIGIDDLVNEIKRGNKRNGKKEWLAFNCLVGIPHMGRVRSKKLVEEFVRVANDLIGNSNKGIITFGNGDASETLKNSSGFASFFEGNLMHYQALLESIEMNFPNNLAEARMALECLFVTPSVSSRGWFERWMETKECADLRMGGLESCRVSRESLEEARELVKGKQSLYDVRIGGEMSNELILEWRGTPLVRVSAWRS
ncbi:protein NODULATION SIGNALING PATHWAY 2-like [Mercurialis annua]|uniref:protein NODULATION SIGNALING PATHWAY 2-like n=1 Tax=Mercurialis annua TaxID=3986 RepID=UPI002160A6E0|nr:protein NODULATION SIGNALING PATHWAY 2-like [Mercurialis annua]